MPFECDHDIVMHVEGLPYLMRGGMVVRQEVVGGKVMEGEVEMTSAEFLQQLRSQSVNGFRGGFRRW